MKRHFEDYLYTWFTDKNRKPLLLRGARQVGKSTVVKNFCKNQNINLIEVNLEKSPLKSLLAEGIDVGKVIDEIELSQAQKLTAKNTILFIDEIQSQPKAITALRYFKEDYPEIAVIAAGSLLELILHKEPISFPVGRIEMQYLGPMTFSEFVMANNEVLYEKMNSSDIKKMSDVVFEKLNELYKTYLLVGGMPEAVKTYIQTQRLQDVRSIQQTILNTYRLDFPKYSKLSDIPKLDITFEGLPKIIGEKLKFSKLNPDLKSRDIKRVLDLFKLARLSINCIHSSGKTYPLSSQQDEAIKKIYFLDIGLYNAAMNNIDVDSLKGIAAEQFIAQHLMYLKPNTLDQNLFYWLRDKDTNKAEVDFLIQNNNQIYPLEIKAEKISKLKSLLVFMQEHKSKMGIKLSVEKYSKQSFSEKISDGKKGVTVKSELLTFPIFMIEKLFEELDSL